MQASKSSISAVAVLAAGTIALYGCGKAASTPTTISYREIGLCKSYDAPSGTEKARADEAFAVFKIEAVDNTNNRSLFNLELERLFVDETRPEQKVKKGMETPQTTRRFVSPDPRFVQSLGVKGVQSGPVPAGQKLDPEGFVVVPVATTNPTGGPEEKKFDLELVYDSSTTDDPQSVNKGITLKKTNPPDSKYPIVEQCKELALK